VNSFTETTAQIVERLGGRIDQLWGSGLVAVFGEYLHTPEITPRPGCQDALEAATEVVQALDRLAGSWLQTEFRIDDFKKMYADHVDIGAAIAIDHGDVMFDYIGGARRRLFMAVGDRVNFVKQLASAAGSQRRPPHEDEASLASPILLSQPAHEWAQHVLKDGSGQQVGAVHRQSMIEIPGMPWPVPIFAIWPDNVDRAARDSSGVSVSLPS
jgi:class 3 adenylate cyclase